MIAAINVLTSGTKEELINLVESININTRDRDNNTLLHHACLLGNVEAVRLLLKCGVHANVGNVDGQTPLCDAALNGSTEIISLLLDNGVNVNPPSYWGSPLMYATQNEYIEVMEKLIDAGAQLNSPDRSGFCPLHVAVRQQFYTGVQLLLFKGADPNLRVRLMTPLHMAAKLNDLHLVRLLLAYGAFPSPLDMDNCTPIQYVSKTSPLYQLLKDVEYEVPSLQSISRLAVHRYLRILGKIKLMDLKLPKHLRDYVNYQFV